MGRCTLLQNERLIFPKDLEAKAVAVVTKSCPCIVLYKATGNLQEKSD